jgi:hypothetical protein
VCSKRKSERCAYLLMFDELEVLSYVSEIGQQTDLYRDPITYISMSSEA